MRSKERVCLYLDGGNFFHLTLKKLKISFFDFESFAQFLINCRLVAKNGKRYYTGTVREQADDPKSKDSLSRQTELLTSLSKNGWEVKTSKLRLRKEKVVIDQRVFNYQNILKKGIYQIEYQRWREKGIDVKIATDVIVGAIDNQYDTAIIISSDSDLAPAIDWVRKRTKKKIEYIGFSIINPKRPQDPTKPSQTMINYSDIQRVLTESELRRFAKNPSLDTKFS